MQSSCNANELRAQGYFARGGKAARPLQCGFFQKELLPPARAFYEHEIGKLSRPSRDWAKGRCPFHPSKSGQSFAVNVVTGGFHCFGCDAKGGDVIAFERLRYRLDFKEACRRLGCWSEDGKAPRRVFLPSALVPFLILNYIIDGIQYRAEIRDEPRNDQQLLRRFHAEAKDRLHEIRNGEPEAIANEEEIQWAILATSWTLLAMEDRDDR
jgi:CHC2-type zinc finger protein